jgi:cyclomaltodextrinase / maltogenic alpha-amylase / neopullulanase
VKRWALVVAALLPALLLALPLTLVPTSAAAQSCQPDPPAAFKGRALYLRGSFNGWAAAEAQKFTWACDRWQLVTRLKGEHRYKVGDEAWSADADFGRGADDQLLLRGPEFERRFDGTYRLTLRMTAATTAPELAIETCPVTSTGADTAAPLGDTTLYLRGTPNNWAALDDYAFQFSCDAYYLNVKLQGRQEFKVGAAAWGETSTVGPNGIGTATGSFTHNFEGEHTIRLAWAGNRPQLSVGPKTFADPRAAAVTDPLALSLRFDSRQLSHKAPFGAITPGTAVQFGVTALPGIKSLTLVVEKRRLEGNQEVLDYSPVARVPMQKTTQETSQGKQDRWAANYTFTDVAIYGYWFEADIGGQLFAFQNNGDAVFWTREKGSGGMGAVAERPANAGPIRRFRQTVFAADFKVPTWAADAVYYYIFPERFRNGDSRNDPKPGRDKYQKHGIEFHTDWLSKPHRPGSGDGSDAVYNNDFYGGDLAGIIDKLDYIKDLGANTIYMTPVFRAASNHKYDTADYHQIDPAFGSNADFERLTAEAAKRGIRVIPDVSLNHTGSDSVYFDRYGNFSQGGASQGAFAGSKINPASPYASWYTLDPKPSDPDKQFKGWVGITDLPELDKNSSSWRNFAYRSPDSVMKRWLDKGAAGWRMDVAPWVPDDFWAEWRAAIKAHKPDAITIAETWFDSAKYFLGNSFDSTMNYIFRNAVLEYAAGGNAQALYANLELMREAYPPQAFYALMNLLSSHDQARSLHVLGYTDDAKDAAIQLAKQRFKLAVFFQMTYPGAPAVYYGDEVGVTGGDDPYNRATYPWADLGGKPDANLLAEFKTLLKLRNSTPVLRRGSIGAPLFTDAHVVVLARQLGKDWAITATNNSSAARTVRIQLPAELRQALFKDALSGAEVKVDAQSIEFTVPALYGRVLLASP